MATTNTAALAAFLMGVAGCSGADGGSGGTGGGACAQRSGVYLLHFAERSGDCGVTPSDQLVTVQQTGPQASGCSGSWQMSADRCEVTLNMTCGPNPQTGDNVQFDGGVRFSVDGSQGSGPVQMTITDQAGGYLCSSIYETTWTRQ